MKKIKNLLIIFFVIFVLLSTLSLTYSTQAQIRNLKILESKISKLSDLSEQLQYEIYCLQEIQNTSNTKSDEINVENLFENPSTEGLTPISESSAQNIWNDYVENILFLKSYSIQQIKQGEVTPNNHLTATAAVKRKSATFKRKAYIITSSTEDSLEYVIGYIDLYTGDVIGGYYLSN